MSHLTPVDGEVQLAGSAAGTLELELQTCSVLLGAHCGTLERDALPSELASRPLQK